MKKLIAMLLAAAMVMSLAACGGSSGSASSDSGSSDSGSASSDSGAAASNGGGTVTIICGYGAGGTADAVARKFAQVANEIQGDYNFIVENVTGGDGFAAAAQFCDEDPSTMDILVLGYGLCYRHDLGKQFGTEEVDFDVEDVVPIASVDDRTWILYTTPDRDLADILEQATTSSIKMSGGNPLSDPHLALGSLLAGIGGNVVVVSGYDGGAEQKKGLTDGEVDVFVGSTQAAQDEVEAGTIVPILAFSDGSFDGFVDPSGPISVPGIAGDNMAPELAAYGDDFEGSILMAGGMLGAHKGCDEDFYNELMDIAKEVWANEDYYGWIESVLLNDYQVYGDEAQSVLDDARAKSIAAYEMMSAAS